MTTFDVFLNGIQAHRLDESEQIKQALAVRLDMDIAKVEQLLSGSGGKRLARDVTEEAAQQYQKDLQTIGAICVYRPGAQKIELSLEAIEEDEDGIAADGSIKCPSCKHEMQADENGITPEKCTQCGISIQKFLEIQALEAEKEAIREQLLRTQNAKNSSQEQERKRQAEEKRKTQLEEEIKKELSIKKDKNPLVLIGGVLLAIVVIGGGYSYFTEEEEKELTTTSGGMAAGSYQGAEGDSPMSAPASPQDAQQALQKTHDQAAQVLDGFGLNADKFADTDPNPATGSSAQIQATSNNANTRSENINNVPAATKQLNPSVSTVLLNESFNKQLWEHFLTQQVDKNLAQNKKQQAYDLSQYITDTKRYIESQGKLLQSSQQTQTRSGIYAHIESRVSSLPIDQQIEFLAQAGLYQYQTDGTRFFLEHANTLSSNLTTPEKQLTAALQLGVAHFKSGNINTANQYFGKINNLTSKIASTDGIVRARIAIAKAYKNVGSAANAQQWLSSVQTLLPQVSDSTFTDTVSAYAYLNQLDSTLQLIQQAPAQLSQDALLIRAIQVFANSGSYRNAEMLLERISTPDYKVSAYILMASHTQDNSGYLQSAESLLDSQLSTPMDKAIVLSQLALQYATRYELQKTDALYQQTRQQLGTLSASPEKERALAIISSNYAHTLNRKYAEELLSLIKSPALRSKLKTEITRSSEVTALIN